MPSKYSVSNWYPALADHTFPTSFLRLRDDELELLAQGKTTGAKIEDILIRLDLSMRNFSGNKFVFTDMAAPTDTERFTAKKGAVHSARSAWRFLAESGKIRTAAANRGFESLCVRPFRNMTPAREFRLFIKDGELRLMSQYWLVRHFRRLETRRQPYWEKAFKLVSEIAWLLPSKDVVVDIYFTHRGEILIIDMNPWGSPTDPLLARSWDRDWSKTEGIVLMPSPLQITGDVNVSF